MIGLGASLAFQFRNGHLARLGKQLRQMALVGWIEVLNQHECQAGIYRQVVEQFRECLKATRGGSHTDNRRRSGFQRVGAQGCRVGPVDRRRSLLWKGRDFWLRFTGFICQRATITFLAGTNLWNREKGGSARGGPVLEEVLPVSNRLIVTPGAFDRNQEVLGAASRSLMILPISMN